nr:transcription factor protein [Cryptomonas curvata]
MVNPLFRICLNKLGLAIWIINECKKNMIYFASSVQQTCIPPILDRKDLIVYSKTGTGKTLTFILPLLHLINLNQINFSTIILIPTRELGLQISDIINKLGKIKKISGFFLSKQQNFLKIKNEKTSFLRNKKTFITTLNFLYQIVTYQKKKKKINMLIIDESDLVINLKLDFLIEKILSMICTEQTLLFASIVNKKLNLLNKLCYKKYLFCYQEKKNEYIEFPNTEQSYIFSPIFLKIFYIETILKRKPQFFTDLKNAFLNISIIFVSSKKTCEYLYNTLKKVFTRVGRLHSKMSIVSRLLTMQMLISKKLNILICTDLGNRGLDCPSIDLVINYNFPKNINTYINRVGRACRFGKNGYCINLISDNEIDNFHCLERKIGFKIKKINFFFDNYILKILSKQK